MKITVFQALVLLAEKYKDKDTDESKEKYANIKSIFLVGICTENSKKILNLLLKDDLFKDKEIVTDSESITNDPVRRYFESHLCNETLKISLDRLDENILNRNFISVYRTMPLIFQFIVPLTIYNPLASVYGIASKKSDVAPEYIAAMKRLDNPDSFQSLADTSEKQYKKRKKKMLAIVRTTHAAITAVAQNDNKFPIPLYKKEQSPYQKDRRGRIDRKDTEGKPNIVYSNNLGIMRSWMPLSRDDELFLEKQSNYVKPTDKATYVSGASVPEIAFQNLVTPFVNSISGTMLCILRVMAALKAEGTLEYQNNETQLKEYFRSMISYMLLNSGGHSLNEFMEVLSLPEIKDEFKDIQGFDELSLKQLFQDENEVAFNEAINKVILYNHSIQNKKAFANELASFHKEASFSPALKKTQSAVQKKETPYHSIQYVLAKFFSDQLIKQKYLASEELSLTRKNYLNFIAKKFGSNKIRKHQIDLLQLIINDSELSLEKKAVTLLAAIEIIEQQIGNTRFSSRLKEVISQLKIEIYGFQNSPISEKEKKEALSNYLIKKKKNINSHYFEKISRDINTGDLHPPKLK